MAQYRLAERRHVVYLGAVCLAVFLLLPHFVGFERVLSLLERSDTRFLFVALCTETLSYFASAGSTNVLTRLFQRSIPFGPLVQSFFAGAAANRTFSTAGAPGMLVRMTFLTRQGLHPGSVASIFVVEDIAGLVTSSLVFCAGVLSLRSSGAEVSGTALTFLLGFAAALLAGLFLYRRRTWAEQAAHLIGQKINAPLERLTRHPVYTPARLQRALDEFYAGVSLAWRAPSLVATSFLLNLLRFAAGAAGLYFAFLALGWTISPGMLVVFFTAATTISSISAVPGELAIVGSGLAFLSLSAGVPQDIALLALVLSRAIAFWLPIPVGLAAFLSLHRQNLV